MKYLVQVTLAVEIERDDDEPTGHTKFLIEENSCPGTGPVGAAIEKAIAVAESNGTCWGCALSGKNKLLKRI